MSNSGKDAKKDKTAQNDKDKFKTAPRLGGTSHKSRSSAGHSANNFALDLENLERNEFSEAVGGKSGSSSDSRRADRISAEEKKKKGSNGEEGDIVSPRGSDKKDKKGTSSRKKEKEKEKKDRDSKKGKTPSSKDKKDLAKRHSAEIYSDTTLLQTEKSPRGKFFSKRGTDDKDEKDRGEKKDKKNGSNKDKDKDAAKKKTSESAKSQDKKGATGGSNSSGTGGKEDSAARRGKKEGVLVARPARKDELFKKQIEEQLKRSLTPGGDKPPISGFRKVGTGEEVEEWDPDKKIHILRTPTLEADPSLEAFNHCGEKPGLEIWRIEKMIPVRWPKKKYGKFHCMDSYICLSTAYSNDGQRQLEWNLHYWIGRKAPKDSYAAAAFRSIQLNEKIGGMAVHYRETQGHESEKFQEYFKYNIKYLKGGTGSALVSVQEEIHETRLLQLLGTRSAVRQVDPDCASLNEGDVFVLDTGERLYVWVGKKAGAVKKAKGMEIANTINAENKGKGEVIVLTGEDRDKEEGFWNSLDGSPSDVADAEEALSDSEVIQDLEESIFLYKVTSVDGEMQALPVEKTPLTKELLETTETYILDCETEMFIWVGKKSLWENKAGGLMLAEDILSMFERPPWTPMTRMVEGNETILFKSKFLNWVTLHPGANNYDKPINTLGSIAPSLQQPKIDVLRMHERCLIADFVPRDEEDSGLLEIWTIPTGGDKSCAEAVPEEEFGEFYSGRSFIILYSYVDDGKIKAISYFWEGIQAPASDYIAYETGLYETLVEKMESEGGSAPKKIRYRQFAEGDFFLSLFENTMIIHFGDGESEAEYAMYDIRGTSPRDTRAVEVEVPQAQYLNSMCSFVLTTPERAYTWYGAGSNSLFRTMANHVANRIASEKEIIHVYEGQESEEFWQDVGGKSAYATAEYLRQGTYPWGYPRLFQCSEATGVFVVDEILSFSQDSLDPSDVMMLDVYYEIYIWIGHSATEKEISMSIETAKEYIALLPEDRVKDIPLQIIRQDEEPLLFKGFFREWKARVNLADEIDAMRQARKEYYENQRFEPSSPLQAEYFDVLNKRMQTQGDNSDPKSGDKQREDGKDKNNNSS